MKENILLEVKQLNNTICQLIAEVNKDNSFTRHPSPLQIRITKYLLENRDNVIYQKDIQESLNISKAAISDTLQSMEKKGVIERIPSQIDGRKIQVQLTKEGKETFKEIDKDMKKINQKIEGTITQEELEEFIRIIHKIKENLKKEGSEC